MSETSTPSEAPAAPPAQQPAPEAPAAQAKPTPGAKSPQETQAALARVAQARRAQVEQQKRLEAIKPLEEVQALLAQGKKAEAFRKLVGGDLEPAYKELTEQFLGGQDESKAMDALPRGVREKLAKMEALEAQLAALQPVAERVKSIEETQSKAKETLEAHQRTAMAKAVWEGAYAQLAEDPEADIVMRHAKADELIQERWLRSLEVARKEPGWAKLTPQERQQKGGELVLTAARELQKEMTETHELVLRARGLRDKNGRWQPQPRIAAPQAPAEPAPKSTPTASVPKTGTPGSLGEPTGTDYNQLSKDDRIALLRKEESSGKFR